MKAVTGGAVFVVVVGHGCKSLLLLVVIATVDQLFYDYNRQFIRRIYSNAFKTKTKSKLLWFESFSKFNRNYKPECNSNRPNSINRLHSAACNWVHRGHKYPKSFSYLMVKVKNFC